MTGTLDRRDSDVAVKTRGYFNDMRSGVRWASDSGHLLVSPISLVYRATGGVLPSNVDANKFY